jgi:hypothetical protein
MIALLRGRPGRLSLEGEPRRAMSSRSEQQAQGAGKNMAETETVTPSRVFGGFLRSLRVLESADVPKGVPRKLKFASRVSPAGAKSASIRGEAVRAISKLCAVENEP